MYAATLISFAPISLPAVAKADAPSLTDYLTGWGTISLAVVTVVTTLVTLYLAGTDRRRDDKLRKADRDEANDRAQAERLARQLAQARLVIVSAPEISKMSSMDRSLYRYEVRFPIVNYGDRPIIGIEAEVWLEGVPLGSPCTRRAEERILLSENSHTLEISLDAAAPELQLGAWRITWTDADGCTWCVDQPQQPEPQPRVAGPPRPC